MRLRWAGVAALLLVTAACGTATPSSAPVASPVPSVSVAPKTPTPSPRPTPVPTHTVLVPVPGPTVQVPVPVPGPTSYVPAPVAPAPVYPYSSVWSWAPLVSGLPLSVHVHPTTNIYSGNLATVYGEVAIVCSAVGQTVSTTYFGVPASSSNWDYVTYPIAGWVADVFIQTSVPPRCG